MIRSPDVQLDFTSSSEWLQTSPESGRGLVEAVVDLECNSKTWLRIDARKAAEKSVGVG